MQFIRTASDSSARLWSDELRCSGVRPRSRLKLSGDDHRAGQEQDKTSWCSDVSARPRGGGRMSSHASSRHNETLTVVADEHKSDAC